MDFTATESRKRPLENGDDEKAPYHLKEPPSLERRGGIRSTNAVMVASDKTTPSRFLPFHFKMLKSLYDSAEEEEAKAVNTASPGGSDKEDSNEPLMPDDVIWQGIEAFLRHRAQILQSQKEAEQAEGAHLAALSYLGKSSSVGSASRSVASESPDPIFRRRTREQAIHSPSILESPLNKSLHRSFASLAGSNQITGQRNPFRLVSVLLQKHAQSIQTQYSESAEPFRQLAVFVKQRMSTLEKEADNLQHALGQSTRVWRQQLLESPRSPPSARHAEQLEARRSTLAAIQAKLQLWKLLHHDLQEIMQGD
uniref:Uncharacterized protein n=1 Tax=Amphora coffeiformis TaxID=265554 RepID=A0A7S3L8P4_9STRA